MHLLFDVCTAENNVKKRVAQQQQQINDNNALVPPRVVRNVCKLTGEMKWKQRWDRLEVQTKRHVQVLGGHLAEMEGAATCAEPFRCDMVYQAGDKETPTIVLYSPGTIFFYEIEPKLMK